MTLTNWTQFDDAWLEKGDYMSNSLQNPTFSIHAHDRSLIIQSLVIHRTIL